MNRYNSNTSSGEFNGHDGDDRDSYRHRRSSPSSFRVGGGGGGGGRRPFDSPPRQHFGSGGGFGSIGGGELQPMSGGFGGSYPPPPMPPPLQQSQQSLAGQKRGFPFSGPADSPSKDRYGGGGSFAKLFVGSVPRTIREEDIRPLFEEHGDVLEVALIKDKRTGQQQGCCFIKYSTTEEADRAIRALHNRHTLPGGVGPIQVRYADGERERLGAVEYKLFVGSLSKQATEKEVEEIFSRFGRVEDVYLMRDELKQSRGCGFVKYADRDMALAAINALNGIYTMRGCDQPLSVRFADPKRPRSGAGESSFRGGAPALGGPGFGPHFQAPAPRQTPNFTDPRGDHVPSNAWRPMSPKNIGPSNPGVPGFGNQLPPRSGDHTMPSHPGVPFGGPSEGFPPGGLGPSSSTSQQGFNQPSSQVPLVGQQISPLHMPLQSPQNLPPSFQLHSRRPAYPQTQTAHHGQPQFPPAGQTPFSQALPPQHFLSLSGQLPSSQPQVQQSVSSSTALQAPLNINLPASNLSATTNQQHLPPIQQSPSQLAQMLSQQTQTLQATFQSSQQAFSQLQQQLQQMQPSNQGSTLQQNPQKQQSQWPGISLQPVASTPATIPAEDLSSSTSSGPAAPAVKQLVAPLECHWTEHTSPDGFKYYHNSLTRESRWEKPEELILFEQQKQQQKQAVQHPTQPHPQVFPTQQASQAQSQTQFQIQLRQQQQQQLQQSFYPSMYSASGIRGQQNAQEIGNTQLPMPTPSMNDPTRIQQGTLTTQEFAWKNKPSGT